MPCNCRCFTWCIRGKLSNSGIFELQNGINFDLEVVEGRSKVRWKAETSYFSIVEISKFLGTMRKPVSEKSHLWVFQKMGFYNIKLCRVTRTCPQWPFFIYNNVWTSKNPKINPGYDFTAGIGRFRFLKILTHKWKFWNLQKFNFFKIWL